MQKCKLLPSNNCNEILQSLWQVPKKIALFSKKKIWMICTRLKIMINAALYLVKFLD